MVYTLMLNGKLGSFSAYLQFHTLNQTKLYSELLFVGLIAVSRKHHKARLQEYKIVHVADDVKLLCMHNTHGSSLGLLPRYITKVWSPEPTFHVIIPPLNPIPAKI